MSRLEDKLREAFKQEDPPSGFAERVLARSSEVERSSWSFILAGRGLRWGFVGLLCLALAVGGVGYHREQVKRAQSEAAKQQLLLALRIAGKQLQFVQSKINQP
jgi:hypothetical protein